MVVFELENESVYSAQIEYYDLLMYPDRLEICIKTNRGDVKYMITATIDGAKKLLTIRDDIAELFYGCNFKIIENQETNQIFINNSSFRGRRLESSFLP